MATTESPLVHQHFWRDQSRPRCHNVIMTVTTFEGIICLSFFAALVTITEKRSWTLVKFVLFRRLQPIHLTLDANHPESEERLTHYKAVQALIPQHDLSILSISRWFGIAAIINVVMFFILGIILPLLLTDSLRTAVVQSEATDTCIGNELNPQRARYATQLADSYYKRCLVSAPQPPSCTQESEIVGSMPSLYENRDWLCPFPGNVCQNDKQTVRFEYKGLRPRDYGINLEARMLIDHRVTCAPIETEKFMYILHGNEGTSIEKSLLWFGHSPFDGPIGNTSALYGTVLETTNGPNHYSSNFSGNRFTSILTARPPYDLKVYPADETDDKAAAEGLHPDLQVADGQVFIVVFRAGRSFYASDEPIDDPFYSAHNKDPAQGAYIPDYEATALGCVEQFRL